MTQRLDTPCLLRPRSARIPVPAQSRAKVRLLCFPYAGGAASVFFGWPEALGPQVDVIWVQLRGRGARFLESPSHHVSEMAEEIAGALTMLDETPFCFYGHSLGALLAFEVARILQSKEKRGPAHLIVGAARAPHLERILSSLGHLPDQDFVDAIQNRYSGIPAAVLQDAELMQLFLPVLRADFNAYEGYRFHEGEPLTCPITTFVGSADPVVTADAMAAWKQHTSASFATHTIAGDHFFLTSNRDTLIQIARDILLNPAPDPVDLSPQTMPVQGVRS